MISNQLINNGSKALIFFAIKNSHGTQAALKTGLHNKKIAVQCLDILQVENNMIVNIRS